MPVRAGPWQQKLREGFKPLKWDATETSEHFLQRPCDERGGLQQNPECNWSAWWSPNYGKETETQMVWPHFKILWHGEDNSAGDSERSKKERKTEEKMGRQHQGMDRNGVWRFPGGSGRQGRMERYCCHVIGGAPMTSEVKGLRWDDDSIVLVTSIEPRQANLCLRAFRHDKF